MEAYDLAATRTVMRVTISAIGAEMEKPPAMSDRGFKDGLAVF